MEFALQTTSSEAGRITARFADLRARGRKVLSPYFTAGYPTPAETVALLERLVRAGADMIELGVPFSDPLADGPTIQRSSQRALEAGASLATTLTALAEFRERHDTPVVLFSYLNPVLAHGVDRFLDEAVAAGADGLLITDLPLGGNPELEARFENSPLSFIRLIAPTTPTERAREIARHAQGFIYYISRTGVTGESMALRDGLTREVAALREVSELPVAVGFGISTPEQAAEVARVADGIIIGSALLNVLDREGADGMERWLRSIRQAMDTI
jgi:tryptophan synthase alpha chain